MRKIDFKFWNKKEKRIQTMDSVSYDFFSLENADLDCIFNNDNLIPLQFSGLYDKNKKPIFEGDIINIEGEKRFVNYSELTGAYMVDTFDNIKSDFLFENIRYSDYKIIGNIYQKELLETN